MPYFNPMQYPQQRDVANNPYDALYASTMREQYGVNPYSTYGMQGGTPGGVSVGSEEEDPKKKRGWWPFDPSTIQANPYMNLNPSTKSYVGAMDQRGQEWQESQATTTGPSAAEEAGAYGTAFAPFAGSAMWQDPTFGALTGAETEGLQSDWMKQVLGEAGEQANSLAAEYGLPGGQSSGQAAALAALTRSQAAIPFARMRYEGQSRGRYARDTARAQAEAQMASARYGALTRGGKTTTMTKRGPGLPGPPTPTSGGTVRPAARLAWG